MSVCGLSFDFNTQDLWVMKSSACSCSYSNIRCTHVCSEAAVRGRISSGPVRQSDPEEPNADSTVPGRHEGSAAGVGEGVRAAMGRRERQTGIHHWTTEGQRPT